MLLYLRKELTQGDNYPCRQVSRQGAEKNGDEGLAGVDVEWRLMQFANWVGRLGQSLLSRQSGSPGLPGPLSGWTDHRDMPELKESFKSRWKRRQKE